MKRDSFFEVNTSERLTQAQKDSNDKAWYKYKTDLLDNQAINNSTISFGNVTRFKKNKVNYDLFNNIIDTKDLEYVCKPFGDAGGALPAHFANRDIVSGKIKVLLGMEMSMPFAWNLVAVNEEATTRKEQKEAEMIRDWVVSDIMKPIQQKIQQQLEIQNKGRKLTPEESQQLQQQIEEETKRRTPDEVRKYMVREHQDPAEILGEQILQYLIKTKKIKDKFNKGWKHMNLSAKQVYYVGAFNGEPDVWVVNPLRFEHDESPDLDNIQDGEWATCEYRLSPSQVITYFGDELSDDEIDRIYDLNQNPASIMDADFTFGEEVDNNIHTIRCKHVVWKSLMKIGFLTYIGVDGKEQEMTVDENYRPRKENGDVRVRWKWIPEVHESWKILNDIYVSCRPLPGQHRDLDNLYNTKLPYYGASCDNLNSIPTCPMDRMKYFQYLYDIIIYRIELLMASDKGKNFFINIKAIPKSAGIDIKKFMYFLEANHIGLLNPNEEGKRTGGNADIVNMVKEVDMSLVSDISKYMNWAEYIDTKCGTSIGVTKQMEAQIAPEESVGNTRQNLIQSSHIIKPYFELHNTVKGDVLQAIVDRAKYEYSQGDNAEKSLSYVLDDGSIRMLKIDKGLLESSKYGLFMANASKAQEAKESLITLSQAAMQNQQADLLDVVRIIRADSITDAEEMLQAGRDRKTDELMMSENAKNKAVKENRDLEIAHEREQWVHEKDMLITKENMTTEREVKKAAVVATGFAEDKDINDNQIPDVLEVAEFGLDNAIKGRKADHDDAKLKLDQDKFAHQKTVDKEKLKIENKKANKPTGSSS